MTLHASLLGMLIGLLLFITWQDVTYRSVPVYVFLLALPLVLYLQYLRCGFDDVFVIQCLLNASVISIQLLAVYAYARWIKKINLSSAIGTGDIVFYVLLIPLLSTPVFIYTHLSSLLMILITYPLLNKILSLETRAIPLAGMQAFWLALLIVLFEWIIQRPLTGSCSLIYWI